MTWEGEFPVLASTACDRQSSSNDLRLWYKQPAGNWNEALPVGNGWLGAMIFGNPSKERTQLNDESLWG